MSFNFKNIPSSLINDDGSFNNSPPPPILDVDNLLASLSVDDSETASSLDKEQHDIDDDDNNEGGFEGPEKLLEVWFEPMPNFVPILDENDDDRKASENDQERGRQGKTGLRCVKRAVWDEMLNIVGCKVLTVTENDYVDAYLLSESSMFVYPHKLILKTCGTTTLLIALPKLLEIANDIAKLPRVWRVFYSRKGFMFPERQPHPHKNWEDEVAFLDRFFDNGAAYTVGKINGNHWNLYLTSPQEDILIANSALAVHHIPEPAIIDTHPPSTYLSTSDSEEQEEEPNSPFPDMEDQTIEILMTNLSQTVTSKFYHHPSEGPPGTQGGSRIDAQIGLRQLYPDAYLNSYLFQPCGYSANGLTNDHYFTAHVTPEITCSYASFETNIPLPHSTIPDLIRKVVDIFQPNEFSATVFNGGDPKKDKRQFVTSLGDIKGYIRKDRILYEFDGYDLVFGSFERKSKR